MYTIIWWQSWDKSYLGRNRGSESGVLITWFTQDMVLHQAGEGCQSVIGRKREAANAEAILFYVCCILVAERTFLVWTIKIHAYMIPSRPVFFFSGLVTHSYKLAVVGDLGTFTPTTCA